MKKIIISKCSGKFGNQLWMFANVLAFALENNRQVHAPSFYKFASHFQYWNTSRKITVPAQKTGPGNYNLHRLVAYAISRINFISNTFLNINLEPMGILSKIPLRGIKGNFENRKTYTRCYFDKPEYEWLVDRILSRKTVMLQGFMFCSSVEKMKKHHHAVCEIFKPQENVLAKIRWLLSQRPEDAFLIGVHIRRGDYKWYRNGMYYYELEDYKKLMRHIVTLFPFAEVKFFICSDEVLNREELAGFNCIYDDKGTPMEDMYLLSACQYITGPPSTFSKWASYFGNVPLYVMDTSHGLPSLTDFKVKYNHYY